jgi:hypothetical protein
MRLLWKSVDRWGPGVIAIIALLVVLWYGRFMEGLLTGLSIDIQTSRGEIETWQAYVVKLQTRLIEAGIKDVPPPPSPPNPTIINVAGGKHKRKQITNRN